MSGSDLKDFCLAIMKCQSSTDERLPILNDFYSTIFKEIQPIHSILDLACGLNPLALPWMPVSKGCNYQAFDVLPPLIGFLNNFLQHVRQKGQASILDLSAEMPNQPADVALLLKTLPTLDQIDKQRARYLLDHCQARHLVVSYPVHSLGGKSKGMIQNYEAHFHTLTCLWEGSIQRFDFITELVFLLTRKEVN
jgi:16S rRNA (guanine(1405)-N(7))-methyltransferase